ncbi:MAG: hypothetical protein MZV70_57835 [Desulfobacterales bacterium]|nr:hypothetical protein [Desulfobacterales bacterium]
MRHLWFSQPETGGRRSGLPRCGASHGAHRAWLACLRFAGASAGRGRRRIAFNMPLSKDYWISSHALIVWHEF